MTEMVQRKAKEIVVFNKKDHEIDFDEFVKEHQSLLVFDCNTSTSMAAKVLSLVALDNINSLNLSDPTFQSCTGAAVQVISPLKNITNMEIRDYVRLFFNREPKGLASDITTVEGIISGIILVYYTNLILDFVSHQETNNPATSSTINRTTEKLINSR